MTDTPLSTVLVALDFAAVHHRDQRRKGSGGAPYVNHLIEVARLVADLAKVEDATVLSAAILHDVLEDTEATSAEISERFGADVAELVEAVTDVKTLTRDERKAHVLEHLQTAGRDGKLIKLADLCSNVGSVPDDWTADRLEYYFDWADRAAALCRGASEALDAEYQRRSQASRGRLSQS